MEQAAAVFIAKKWKQAAASHQRIQEFGHAVELVPITRGRLVGQNLVEHEKIEGVEVIVGGLLEVAAVRSHLPFHLLHYDLVAETGPGGGARQLGKCSAQRMERHRFAQQMRVGGEVHRQVVLQMKTVLMNRVQPTLAKLFFQVRSDQVKDPHPRQCAKSHLERAGPIDSALKRVRVHPAIELFGDLVQEFFTS